MPRESTGNAPRSHPRHAKRSEIARQSCGAQREQKVDRKAERNRTGRHLVTIRERRSQLWCAKPLGLSEQARPAALPLPHLPFGMSPRPLGEFHLAVHHALVWCNGLCSKGQMNVLALFWRVDEANKCYNFNHGTPPSFAEPPPRKGPFHQDVSSVVSCFSYRKRRTKSKFSQDSVADTICRVSNHLA